MPEISKDELVDEVSKLMEMDENELYEVLGCQSFGLEGKPTELLLGFSSITKSEWITRGRIFFDRNKQGLKEKICDDYCKKRDDYKNDFSLLTSVLVPVAATGLGLPESLILVLCALAFKYGLDRLCECRA